MILIITMAGERPFGNDSYRSPNYLLPWGERTVLAAVLGELVSGGGVTEVILVGSQRDEEHMPHVRAIMRGLGIDKHDLFLVAPTSGQAETAALGLALREEKRGPVTVPVLFHNADTILYRRTMQDVATALRSASGYIDVFRANHHKYSYVLLDEQRRVSEIAEKIVISDTATSGLYGFAGAGTFREHYVKESDTHISSVYKRMIARGAAVVAGAAHSETDTVVLGTPDDYINASIRIA